MCYQHHNTKIYIFFSTVHKSYSRIDYFFIPYGLLVQITASVIEPMFFSDHAPTTLTGSLAPSNIHTISWQINESLLQDEWLRTELLQELTSFFTLNDTTDA